MLKETRTDLTIDEEKGKILDSEGKVQYTFQLNGDGDITVQKTE